MRRHFFAFGILAAAGWPHAWASSGFDTGWPLKPAGNMIDQTGIGGEWVRIHSRSFDQPKHFGETTAEEVEAGNRAILMRIRSSGRRIVCMTNWAPEYWTDFVSEKPIRENRRVLVDLREAFERSRALAITYGDLVDVWEVDNEPDVYARDTPDVFAAFHKAVALGLADGRRARVARITNDEGRLARWRRWFDMTNATRPSPAWAVGLGEGAAPGLIREYPRNPRMRFAGVRASWGQGAPPSRSLVLMAAPGLPPGPHFEQLLANGYLSYTEGFNYHHYGFAMDYAGVYAQFRDAVTEFNHKTHEKHESRRDEGGDLRPETNHVGDSGVNGGWARIDRLVSASIRAIRGENSDSVRRLPVFLTEWGYSLLDGYDAQTVDGRVRQWRYFSDVAQQNERLRVAAPMAFLLRPYFEIKAKEFGLSMPSDEARAKHYGWEQKAGSKEQGAGGGKLRPEGGDLKPEGVGGGVGNGINHDVAREREDGRGRSLRPRSDSGVGDQRRVPFGPPWKQKHERHEKENQEARPGSAGFQPASDASKPAGKDAGVPSEEPPPAGASTMEFSAGGLTFRPEDFGAESVVPWMERIGERVGDAEASPALAWLLDRAGTDPVERRAGRAASPLAAGVSERRGAESPPYPRPKRSGPRDWVVRTERPSPVVMDFVAGAETKAVKSDHGYWLWGQVRAGKTEGGGMVREGAGVMVFYNFGPVPAEVVPVWPEWIRPVDGGAELTLAPGERREVAVVLCARADRLLPVDARIAAKVRSGGGRTVSRWASRFYALSDGVVPRERDGFDFAEGAAEANRALLLARPHAPEEPALRRDGRWLVTEGMRVEETDWGWRLHVEHFPGMALRPAVAELPLPAGWSMPTGAMLSYDYRLVDGDGAVELSAATPDARLRRQTGIAGNLAESYIRTTTGNLFGTQPRLSATADWKSYRQSAETLTMHFLGRTEPPWRFSEHKPAALVFFVRPVRLPAIFEVRHPQVIELEAGW